MSVPVLYNSTTNAHKYYALNELSLEFSIVEVYPTDGDTTRISMVHYVAYLIL